MLNDCSHQVYQFSLQTMHHPLKFNGMSFFYFGNEFLIQVHFSTYFHSVTLFLDCVLYHTLYGNS